MLKLSSPAWGTWIEMAMHLSLKGLMFVVPRVGDVD